MKKHILFIVENNPFPDDIRVFSEALAAKEFGYDVSVICPAGARKGIDPKEYEGVDVYEHPSGIEGSGKLGLILEYINALFWEILLTIRIFIKKPFHAIHAANPPDHLFILALPFKLLGIKYIFDHHDISPETYVAKFGRKDAFYYLLQVMEWLSFKTADVVISTNESYKRLAIDRGGKTSEDVFVVRNGPDLTRVIKTKANDELRNGFKYLVGYVGTIGQQEGIEHLLRSVDYIVNVKKRTDIKFIIVGKGPYWNDMVMLSKNMKLDDYVLFTGFIPDAKLYEILSTVDICVNPEYRNEFTDKSTMIKIMEYMAFGKPIVQYYTTEGKVTAGDAAAYVAENSEQQYAEILVEVLDNVKRRQQMGAIARARIEESLSWAKQKLVLKNAYAKIL